MNICCYNCDLRICYKKGLLISVYILCFSLWLPEVNSLTCGIASLENMSFGALLVNYNVRLHWSQQLVSM